MQKILFLHKSLFINQLRIQSHVPTSALHRSYIKGEKKTKQVELLSTYFFMYKYIYFVIALIIFTPKSDLAWTAQHHYNFLP